MILDYSTRGTFRILDMHATESIASVRSDSSGVLPRPPVDPAIRGQPQGWDDDLSIPVESAEPAGNNDATTRSPVPFPPPLPAAVRPGLGALSEQNHRRLNSFRGLESTRSKLSTWRDRAFPELVEGRRRRNEVDPRPFDGTIAPAYRTGEGRTREFEEHYTNRAAGPSTLSSRSATLAASTTQRPLPLASTVGSEDDFANLFIPPSRDTDPLSRTNLRHRSARPSYVTQNSYGSASTSTSVPPSDLSSPGKERRSVSSSQSGISARNRDRVMGLQPPPTRPPVASSGSRLFAAPDVNDVLPFASTRLYSAWDIPTPSLSHVKHQVSPIKTTHPTIKGRRRSVSTSVKSEEDRRGSGKGSIASGLASNVTANEVIVDGWKDLPRQRFGTGQKRVWLGSDSQEILGVYRVGWERDVLDL
jgi:hypothetical protein